MSKKKSRERSRGELENGGFVWEIFGLDLILIRNGEGLGPGT